MRYVLAALLMCLVLSSCTVGIVRREVVEVTPIVVTATYTTTPLATETPTSVATATPIPSPTLIPTPTPFAVRDVAPTPVPPTPTATPTPYPTPCGFAIAPAFSPRLNEGSIYQTALGCPTGRYLPTWAAEERFQRGRMFWQEYPDTIYILFDNTGTYQIGPDLYIEETPEDACPDVGDAPDGLYKPIRGFNWQWCRLPYIRQTLGWALEEEIGYDAVWQRFEHGQVLLSHDNHIFIFYDNGGWSYID